MGINHILSQKKHGFTLIEILVVIGVVAIALPVMFAIIYSIMRAQIRLYRLTEVKRQGDFVINSVSSTIRNNAVAIYSKFDFTTPICTTAGAPYVDQNPLNHNSSPTDAGGLFFKDKTSTDKWFRFYYNNAQIASASGTMIAGVQTIVGLNSARVMVSNFVIQCARQNIVSPPIVQVSFDICFNVGTSSAQQCQNQNGRAEETTPTIHYQTNIVLKKY